VLDLMNLDSNFLNQFVLEESFLETAGHFNADYKKIHSEHKDNYVHEDEAKPVPELYVGDPLGEDEHEIRRAQKKDFIDDLYKVQNARLEGSLVVEVVDLVKSCKYHSVDVNEVELYKDSCRCHDQPPDAKQSCGFVRCV